MTIKLVQEDRIIIVDNSNIYEVRGIADVESFMVNNETPMPFELYEKDKPLIKTYATIELAKRIRQDRLYII